MIMVGMECIYTVRSIMVLLFVVDLSETLRECWNAGIMNTMNEWMMGGALAGICS